MVITHELVAGPPHHDLGRVVRGHAAIVAELAEHAEKRAAELAAIRTERAGADLPRRPAS